MFISYGRESILAITGCTSRKDTELATGNKPVKGRTNKRKSKVGKRPERRGGARKGTGPKDKPVVRNDMRSRLITRMDARAKKEKKDPMDVWIDILYDKKFRITGAGGKVVAQMFEVLFLGSKTPPATPGKPLPAGEGGEDDPELTGPPDLPPLKPDPARLVPFKPDDE